MSSDYKITKKPSLKKLLSRMKASRLHEIDYPYLELKSTWNQKYGKDISAIANHESLQGGWLVIGIDDKGNLLHHHKKWAKKTEEEISQQINQFLSPYQAVESVIVKKIQSSYCIFLDIQNPGDVTEWRGEAYRRSGTSSTQMKSDERIALAMKLPGEDFSNQPWNGPIDTLLISSFAQKMAMADPSEFPEDLSTLSSSDILARLGLKDKMVAGILFGNFPVRIARYDSNDDIIENTEKKGVYHILTDDFIAQIQTWTKKQGTILKGHTASVTEEYPYPPKIIREILANAVAHALYQREQGAIIVDISPDHLTVRNNASLEAKVFAKQWFAKNTYVKNKLLMTILRAARITDELGTGKNRIFRLSIESGRREPTIDFSEHRYFGKWKITIYNNHKNKNLKSLMDQFYQYFPTEHHARIAMALVRLTVQGHKWSSILEHLDDYYADIALEVIQHQNAPIIIIDNEIFLRRWVGVALTGQASQSFTPAEEKQIKDALRAFAFQHSTKGFITTSEARELIGLGDSHSEATQLSNLFRKWRDKKIVKYIKRGHWQFISGKGRKKVMMPSRLQN